MNASAEKTAISKGDRVFYSTGSADVRAKVQTMHRDGSVTVKALFYVGNDGKDAPGYLGFNYRLDAVDLRTSARARP